MTYFVVFQSLVGWTASFIHKSAGGLGDFWYLLLHSMQIDMLPFDEGQFERSWVHQRLKWTLKHYVATHILGDNDSTHFTHLYTWFVVFQSLVGWTASIPDALYINLQETGDFGYLLLHPMQIDIQLLKQG